MLTGIKEYNTEESVDIITRNTLTKINELARQPQVASCLSEEIALIHDFKVATSEEEKSEIIKKIADNKIKCCNISKKTSPQIPKEDVNKESKSAEARLVAILKHEEDIKSATSFKSIRSDIPKILAVLVPNYKGDESKEEAIEILELRLAQKQTDFYKQAHPEIPLN